MRSYVLSSLCAVIAGLMNVAQSKDADPQFGLGAELIAIASVIVGGAAIFGGRGRVIGSCLGAIFVGLIDKVLREGVPIMRDRSTSAARRCRSRRSRNCRRARCPPCSASC